MTTTSENSPRWQLDSIFPGLDSAEFAAARGQLERSIAQLEQHVESGLGTGTGSVEGTLRLANSTYLELQDVSAYVFLLISVDAFNEEAQAVRSELAPIMVRFGIVDTKLTAWLGTLDLDRLLGESEYLAAHEFSLRKSARLAGKLLAEPAEEIAAALAPTGGGAWARLHDQLISRETIRMELPGREAADYGIAELFNLQMDEEESVRRAAWQAEMQLLERNQVSFAAAMNSIKGQVHELAQRRGWDSALDEALFQNHIDRETLDALQEAVKETFPLMRRYLKAKARRLGKEQLGWHDRMAPVKGAASRTFTWDEAREFVVRQFRTYSDELADFADSAFERGWLDGPPRKGKTNGAFCMEVGGKEESRIMLNFGGTLDDLFTIGHELGHSYHADRMFKFGRTALQRRDPMTLAETASIFCETIIFNAVMKDATEAERLGILEQDLAGAAQLILDIHSRFLFESGVFEKRASRELSISELNGLMLDAQEQTYGEAIDVDERNPWMWAHKGHYYSASRSFYNFPYTFGYLFGLGLYAEYQRQPDGFHDRYDELLASSGMGSAWELGQTFGIDIRDPDFWRGSLVVLQERVEEYERLP